MTALLFLLSFVMAFLLFAVQPMATKMVLPTLGGTPAVWNTAMMVFQLLLLMGYAYAHVLVRAFKPRHQRLLHGLLLAISFACLPLTVTLVGDAATLEAPIAHLSYALLFGLGLPFVALAATAPLLQAWVSHSVHPMSRQPYVLYSASNLGSLMALLGYVTLVEPALDLNQQSYWWSALYMLGAVGLCGAGWSLVQHHHTPATAPQPVAMQARPRQQILWVWLSFLASACCLSVTSYITTDLAAIPLLWVVPLSIYLLSFVDAFRVRPRIAPYAMRAAPLCGMAALLLYSMQYFNMVEQFGAHVLLFAVLVFGMNGWLAQAKPATPELTRFYFCLAIGGALGGILNAVVAPMVFDHVNEYPLTLLAASLTTFLLMQQRMEGAQFRLVDHEKLFLRVALFIAVVAVNLYLVTMAVMHHEWRAPWDNTDYRVLLRAVAAAALLSLVIQRRYASAFYGCAALCIVILVTLNHRAPHDELLRERNFFGVLRVVVFGNQHQLYHNTTLHSFQIQEQVATPRPTAYYANLADVFAIPVVAANPVAVVGLGAGTMKCHLRPGQRIDFIDINPAVIAMAEKADYFTFLRDCPGEHRTLVGDGRVVLAAQTEPYGLIAIDAFSSDAIPAHLITTEAIELYMSKLAPHGVLAIHTTNRYLNLWPLLATQAKQLNLVAYGREWQGESFWVVLARGEEDVASLRAADGQWQRLVEDGRPAWTDRYVNMIPYFMWGRKQRFLF